MSFEITFPELPTLARFTRLRRAFGRKTSTLRLMQYEFLESREFSGRLVDIGGGETAGYRHLLGDRIEYVSVNITDSVRPTHVIKPDELLPLPDAYADHVLAMNTLEHVYDDIAMMREMCRVAKPGGLVTISVPFFFRIHASPMDYHRHTADWWGRKLGDMGMEDVTVRPLVWGRHSSTKSQMTGGLSRNLADLRDIAVARIIFGKGLYHGRRGLKAMSLAAGYAVTARRAGAAATDE